MVRKLIVWELRERVLKGGNSLAVVLVEKTEIKQESESGAG